MSKSPFEKLWKKHMVDGPVYMGIDIAKHGSSTVEYDYNTRTGEISNVREFIAPERRE